MLWSRQMHQQQAGEQFSRALQLLAFGQSRNPVAHKLPGAESSVITSNGFSTAIGTVACDDLHRQHMFFYFYFISRAVCAPEPSTNRQ